MSARKMPARPAVTGEEAGALRTAAGWPAAQVKACCAAAYGSDLVALLLGDSYHPGGAALTRRLAALAGVRPGERVLDVASGPGTTALLLAREHGVTVDGVDLSADSVARASAAAWEARLADRVAFRTGDAERLSVPDGRYDVMLCERPLCTFPDQQAAAAAFARVLRPGGRAAIADVTVSPDGLGEQLRGLAGRIACLSGARPLDGYAELLRDAGLVVTVTERHDDALTAMIDQIDARLRLLRMTRKELPGLGPDGYRTALEMTELARRAVAAGTAGYALIVAQKPRRHRAASRV